MIANTPGASTSARPRGLIMAALTPLLIWGTHPAAAQDCGATIGPEEPGVEVFLDGDIGPCDTDPALTIEGPVTVNLNRFTISCVVPDPKGGEEEVEGFVGIEVVGVNAWVLNGVVEDCEDGVVVDGRPEGGQHILTNLTVRSTQNQVGNRGFRVRSDGNHLINNRAIRFSGIGFRVDGSDNRLVNNVARNNEDEGFRIEPDAQNNTLLDNRARNNGATDNEAGLRIRGDGNTVFRNFSIRNFGDGILLEVDEEQAAANNTVIHNVSLFNVGTDLVDENLIPECDSNRWLKNRFLTKSEDCID
jgi:parallel beta-helix repeat protein